MAQIQLFNILKNLNNEVYEFHFIVCDKVSKEELNLKKQLSSYCSTFTELKMKSLFDFKNAFKVKDVFNTQKNRYFTFKAY